MIELTQGGENQALTISQAIWAFEISVITPLKSCFIIGRIQTRSQPDRLDRRPLPIK